MKLSGPDLHASRQRSRRARVTCALELEGKFYIVENVPARVCRETGEQLFSPRTVQHLSRLIRGERKPKRLVSTPVFEYA
jgi:YgiT-type zinc finger domain-containing protein